MISDVILATFFSSLALPCGSKILRLLALMIVLYGMSTHVEAKPSSVGISGQVTDALSGKPLKRVHVNVRGSVDGYTTDVMTDENGHFDISPLKTGFYIVTADRAGYITHTHSGPDRRGLVTLDTTSVELNMKLLPQGVITGRVVDEAEEPIAGATVLLARSTVIDGRRQLRPAGGSLTNDAGAFRLPQLNPGRYYIVAMGRQGQILSGVNKDREVPSEIVYPPVFYPNARELSTASLVTIQAGEVKDIEFRLIPMQSTTVRGELTGGDSGMRRVTLTQYELLNFSGTQHHNVKFESGSTEFTISGVVPGNYLLHAEANDGRGWKFASRSITVGADMLDSVRLDVQRPLEVTGTLSIESDKSSGTQVPTGQIVIRLSPIEQDVIPRIASGFGTPGSKFTIPEVVPGKYMVAVQELAGYYIKSVQQNGQDMTTSGVLIGAGASHFEITISGDSAVVEGVVHTSRQSPSQAIVVIASKKREAQTLTTQTDANSMFKFSSVPPGEYTMFAVPISDESEYASAHILEQCSSSSTAISVRSRERASIELQLCQPRE